MRQFADSSFQAWGVSWCYVYLYNLCRSLSVKFQGGPWEMKIVINESRISQTEIVKTNGKNQQARHFDSASD